VKVELQAFFKEQFGSSSNVYALHSQDFWLESWKGQWPIRLRCSDGLFSRYRFRIWPQPIPCQIFLFIIQILRYGTAVWAIKSFVKQISNGQYHVSCPFIPAKESSAPTGEEGWAQEPFWILYRRNAYLPLKGFELYALAIRLN